MKAVITSESDGDLSASDDCPEGNSPRLNGVVERQKAVAITTLLAHNKD